MSDKFKEVIQNRLNQELVNDPDFSLHYNNPDKNIADCLQYILTEVKNSGCEGFADEEIYDMAIAYYKNPTVVIDKDLSANVVVNQSMPKPIKKIIPKTPEPNSQLTLF